jgi:hypothetical protein
MFTYDDNAGTFTGVPDTFSESQVAAIQSSFTAELNRIKAENPGYFSLLCPNGTPEQLAAALVSGNEVALRQMLSPAEFNSINNILASSKRKITVSDLSQLRGAKAFYDVSVTQRISLSGKATLVGKEFQKDFIASSIPSIKSMDAKTVDAIKVMKPGEQHSFMSQGKRYVAVAEEQKNGVAVGVFKTPLPKAIDFQLSNKGVLYGGKALKSTTLGLTFSGSVDLGKLKASPFLGARVIMPHSKLDFEAAGVDFYINTPLSAGASLRYPLGKTLDLGLSYAHDYILSKATTPRSSDQYTVSLLKTIPVKHPVVIDVSMGQMIDANNSSLNLGAGIGIQEVKLPFYIGVQWNAYDAKKPKEGIPGVVFRISLPENQK